MDDQFIVDQLQAATEKYSEENPKCVMLFSSENRIMGRSDASEAVVCDGARERERIIKWLR